MNNTLRNSWRFSRKINMEVYQKNGTRQRQHVKLFTQASSLNYYQGKHNISSTSCQNSNYTENTSDHWNIEFSEAQDANCETLNQAVQTPNMSRNKKYKSNLKAQSSACSGPSDFSKTTISNGILRYGWIHSFSHLISSRNFQTCSVAEKKKLFLN